MAKIETYLLTVLIVLVGHVNSEFCYSYGYSSTIYCAYGCCGGSGSQYCCSYYLNGGAVAGIVIGCLVGVGVLIAAIVIWCCIRHRRAANGQVLNANPWFSTATTTTTAGMMTTQMSPGVYPPAYQPPPQMASGYPAYTYDNAAGKNQSGGPPPSYN